MIEEAAKSFYAADCFEEAKKYFIDSKLYSEAGETILKLVNRENNNPNLYLEAIKCFEMANNFMKAIEICLTLRNFAKILELIFKYKRKIVDYEKVLESYLIYYLKDEEDKISEKSKISKIII